MRIVLLVVVALVATTTLPARPPPPRPPLFPPAGEDEAWALLPRKAPPLPAWARVLVRSLPRTTGAMLELDHLHRARNPLGARLAATLRWVAADTAKCEYARRYAAADLRRAGPHAASSFLDRKQRALVVFARKMTENAASVTDAEVAELLRLYGPAKVVAMVHTLAHANFQNRLFQALGVEMEEGGPLPPTDFGLSSSRRAKVPTPSRPPWDDLTKKGVPDVVAKPGWREWSIEDLQAAMEKQKERKSRIPLLSPDKLTHLAPDERGPAARIIWSNVSMGHQPEMTRAWFNVMSTFQQEAQLNRLFTASLFWVITRSNECFY